MSRDDIRKLLGGYATGTLTPDEQQTLFEAALDDQELFDALAREQSLRDLLRDPSAKATLLAALDAKPRGWWASWWRPASLAAATAGIAVLAVLLMRTNAPKPQPVTVAIATPPEAPKPVEAESRKSEPPAPAPQRTAAPAAAKAPRVVRRETMDSVSVASGGGVKYVGGAPAGIGGGVAGGVLGVAPETVPPPPPAKGEALPPAPPTPMPATAPKPEPAAVPTAPPPTQALPEAAPPPPPPILATAPAPKKREAPDAPRAQDLFLGAQIPVSMAAESRFLPTERVQDQATPRQRAEVQSGRSETLMLGAALSSALTMAPQSGVRYAILRRSAGGKPEEVNLEDVKAGEEVSLRFETNAAGFLSAWARSDAGTWRTLGSFTVERMRPYITRALNRGDNEIHVWFSRQRQMAMSGPGPPTLGLQPAANLTERAGALTYVVTSSTGADAQQVRFTIRLR